VTALRAASAIGLDVAGVDMLISKNGPMIMEINSSPGLEGIETTTGVDVATSIIRHMERILGRKSAYGRIHV
jgi:ribosomal protein S6--L-glutamate ligase